MDPNKKSAGAGSQKVTEDQISQFLYRNKCEHEANKKSRESNFFDQRNCDHAWQQSQKRKIAKPEPEEEGNNRYRDAIRIPEQKKANASVKMPRETLNPAVLERGIRVYEAMVGDPLGYSQKCANLYTEQLVDGGPSSVRYQKCVILERIAEQFKWKDNCEYGISKFAISGDFETSKLFEDVFGLKLTAGRKVNFEFKVTSDELVQQITSGKWDATSFQVSEGEHKMVITSPQVTIFFHRFHFEDRGRYAIEGKYGSAEGRNVQERLSVAARDMAKIRVEMKKERKAGEAKGKAKE
ncbi:hypothetical protein H072_9678 [Dactylellina haptotyla CBS 200.50]|uniref:Uncharacterized protein n=1 Tax=Dactylellina haptotyla (strain CBS 200.50) TaxID=1284197 RepID=S8BC29_DACHA|nr:hypothetical protein H072_9678 [Dactylellina haptotyla CBS 200.50]